MPSHDHLQPLQIKDFAPGLWTRGDWLLPPTAAQTMQDCFPQPGGGLRAWFKPTAISVSGIADITKERIIGLHARGGVGARAGTPTDSTDRYLCTYMYDSSAGAGNKARPKLYRMDGTNSETTWTQIYATSGTTQFAFATNDSNAPAQSRFRYFQLSSGSPNDQYVLMALNYVGSDNGLWRMNYNDLSTAQKAIEIDPSTPRSGAMCIHQARVMIATGTSSPRLWWSNAGTVTFASTSYLDIEPSQDLNVLNMLFPQPPSDLLVAKEGAPWVVIQGDITDPIVRQMGGGGHTSAASNIQDGCVTDQGIAFIDSKGDIYLTDGVEFRSISKQLSGFSNASGVVSLGSLTFMNHFLFAPGGKVYDFDSQSWFTQTGITGNFHNAERYGSQVWGGVGTSTNFTLNSVVPYEVTDRVNTYTWKSAPLHEESGRQLEIREVEIVCKSYDTSATIAVTIGGTTVSKTLAASTKQKVSFYFVKRAEVLDVQVVSTAGNASNEAPSIEAITVWTRPGHSTL